MILFILLSLNLIASSHAAIPEGCFDLSKPNLTTLRPEPAKYEIDKDPSQFGTDEKKNDWGEVSGVVQKPILELYQKLLDPKTIRNGSNTKVEVETVETKDFLKKIIQSIRVKPVFFITIDWKEDWAYSVKEGTEKEPKVIVISYQKKEGTSHIKHLCGNILLKQIDPKSTAVYLVEEVQADRRSAEDVLKGITGTLRTLRE